MVKLNMFPMFTCHNPINTRSSHSKIFTQFGISFTCGMPFSDFENFKFSQNMMGRKFSSIARITPSSLLFHISLIFGNRSNLEMFGIDTFTVITNVHNYFSQWDWSIMQFIRKTMSMITTVLDAKFPISFFIKEGLPKPTCGSFFNFFPKSDFSRFKFSHGYDDTIDFGKVMI